MDLRKSVLAVSVALMFSLSLNAAEKRQTDREKGCFVWLGLGNFTLSEIISGIYPTLAMRSDEHRAPRDGSTVLLNPGVRGASSAEQIIPSPYRQLYIAGWWKVAAPAMALVVVKNDLLYSGYTYETFKGVADTLRPKSSSYFTFFNYNIKEKKAELITIDQKPLWNLSLKSADNCGTPKIKVTWDDCAECEPVTKAKELVFDKKDMKWKVEKN